MNVSKVLSVIFLFTVYSGWSQGKVNLKKLEKQADKFLAAEAWHRALPLLLKLDSLDPTNKDFNFKTGMCYYHTVDKNKSLNYFKIAEANSDPSEELDFYLGRAYHYNNRFDEAIKYYEKFRQDLINLNKTTDPRYKEVERYIENCEVGKELVRDSVTLEIVNIGEVINSEYPEYGPIIPADESFMIFTSRREDNVSTEQDADGRYHEDMYISYKNDKGEWQKPQNLGFGVNSFGHDAGIGLSSDGSQLLIYKSNNGGDIYISDHSEDGWTIPVPLSGEVNTAGFESSACFTADSKHIYFTSEREGGYGGSDIYKAELLGNGTWGNIVNLGPEINTQFNEEAPQIHSDSKTLFFSSRGHNSMGGFDIFSSNYNEDSKTWSPVRNIGYPINTADEDIYFVLAANGVKAYFSSYRNDTHGEVDIYILKRPNSSPTSLLFRVNLPEDGSEHKPIAGRIILSDKETGAVETFESEDISRSSHAFHMEFEKEYDLIIEAEGFVRSTFPVQVMYRADIFEYVMNVDLQKTDSSNIVIHLDHQSEEFVERVVVNDKEVVREDLPPEKEVIQEKEVVQEDLEPDKEVAPKVMEPEVEPAKISTGDINVTFVPGVLQFDFDKNTLNGEAIKKLNQLVIYLKSNDTNVKISGYTDTYGPEDYNLFLSKKRAKSAYDYLAKEGIKQEQLSYQGYGEANPIADNSTLASRKLNRRVEFVIKQ
ncbi:MAG: OmpA family protein [Bacteroidetes bacterium]|nr:OmpA family protein [Bacteroidota bacterium]